MFLMKYLLFSADLSIQITFTQNYSFIVHKIFAKTSFLGKKVEYLPECHSTNSEVRQIVQNNTLYEGLVLHTDHQTEGRGQRGNVWIDQSGKHLLFSVYLKPSFLEIKNQYLLYIISALCVYDGIQEYLKKPELLKVKWPNDVYIDRKKVCGILIENMIRHRTIDDSIIGIGLNVNQNSELMPGATSLCLESGGSLDRFTLMESIITHLEKWYLMLRAKRIKEIVSTFESHLFRLNEEARFLIGERVESGIIQGIDSSGKLIIRFSDRLESFDHKEITFLI
jgi:BirA family biotin operon repressor/biotin-[acetyl-CoA-carboxylase] ligase